MMAPSIAYPLPRSDLPRPRRDAERFAVLEYGSPSLAWMKATAAPPLTRPRGGLFAFLARFRARSAAKAPRPAVQPGIAAMQLVAEAGRGELNARMTENLPSLVEGFHPGLAVLHAIEPAADEDLAECPP